MKVQVIVLLALLAFASAARKDFGSAKYLSQTAQEKMDQLWKEITADTNSHGWYSSLAILKLLFEDMKVSFDTYSDIMPEGRNKYIHPVGSVAQVEFIPEPTSPYTGMFQGVDNALLRISLAKQPDPKSKPDGNFLPGLGIKLLRDGVPSANLIAMYSLDGQDSWNIFKNDWSHHIANPCSFALKILAKKFETATPYIGRMGLKTWAQYDQKGNQVQDSKIKVPFRLYFRPASDVQNMFPDQYVTEFTKQLATIPVGTRVYDLYAVAKPHADAIRVGTFRTKSNFTTSMFGDTNLFFQHNYEEDDLKIHPEWTEEVKVDPPVKPHFEL